MVMVLPITTSLREKNMNVMPGIWLSELLGNKYLEILAIWNAYRKNDLEDTTKKA